MRISKQADRGGTRIFDARGKCENYALPPIIFLYYKHYIII